MASIVMTGDVELQRMTRDLMSQGKHGKKIFRKGLRAGAKIVAKDTKATFPRKSGRAAASVKVKAMKRSRTRVGFRVSVFATANSGRWKEAPYPMFLERGTKKHVRGKRVRKSYGKGGVVKDSTKYDAAPTHVAAQHNVEKSLARSGPQAQQTILKTCAAELEKLSIKG
jgi:hypothetical protein